MYGGTCINIGCIPTKTLLVAAEKDLSFEEVVTTKKHDHWSPSTVKTMRLLLVQALISLMRKLTSFQIKSSKSKLVMKERTDC